MTEEAILEAICRQITKGDSWLTPERLKSMIDDHTLTIAYDPYGKRFVFIDPLEPPQPRPGRHTRRSKKLAFEHLFRLYSRSKIEESILTEE
jgi:hypothetical protein